MKPIAQIVDYGGQSRRRGQRLLTKRDGPTELLGALIGVLLFCGPMLCGRLAHADIPDPCAPGYDPDAGVVLRLDVPLPDGGAEDLPVALCPGQRAPAPLVAFTVRENAKRVAERAQLRTENQLLAAEVAKKDKIPGYVWLLSCVGGVIVTGWCSNHDCNPLHIGRK